MKYSTRSQGDRLERGTEAFRALRAVAFKRKKEKTARTYLYIRNFTTRSHPLD